MRTFWCWVSCPARRLFEIWGQLLKGHLCWRGPSAGDMQGWELHLHDITRQHSFICCVFALLHAFDLVNFIYLFDGWSDIVRSILFMCVFKSRNVFAYGVCFNFYALLFYLSNVTNSVWTTPIVELFPYTRFGRFNEVCTFFDLAQLLCCALRRVLWFSFICTLFVTLRLQILGNGGVIYYDYPQSNSDLY